MVIKPFELARFFLKFSVGKRNQCWEWQGATDKDGYGLFHLSRRGHRRQVMVKAHRVSYLIDRGPIPKGMLVRHKCDNPGCVNPNHLILGTCQNNTDDIIERQRFSVGEQHGAAKLTNKQFREIQKIVSKPYRPFDRVVAEQYGVSRQLIQLIRTGIARNGKQAQASKTSVGRS